MVDVPKTELFIFYLFTVYFFGFVFSRTFQRRSTQSSHGRSGSQSATSIRFSKLKQPSWAPPRWLFGVVWPIMYTLQAIAVYLIRLNGGWGLDENFGELLTFAILQIVLSAYTILFTISLLLSTIIIYISLFLTIVTTVLFWKIELASGALLIPLILWLAYATALSTTIYRLNKNKK